MVLSRKYRTVLKHGLEIVPSVYQINTRATNVILIAEEELTIIDTGLRGSSARIIDFIRSLGRSVEEISLIILTHNHFDHAGGLVELRKLTKAKVAAHKADIDDAEGQIPYPGLLRRLLRVPFFSGLRSVFLLQPGEVDIQLEGGEVLRPLGGLEVVHTPGHTPGSISLFSPQNKLLIVGDALNKGRKNIRLPLKIASIDLTQAIDSVRRIAQLDFDSLCFGHGRPLTADVRTRMQALIEKIKD